MIQFFLIIRNMEAESLNQVQSMIAVMEPSIARAVWQMNTDAIDIILRSSTSLHGVAAASFQDSYIKLEAISSSFEHMEPEQIWQSCQVVMTRDLTGLQTDGIALPEGRWKLCYTYDQPLSELTAVLLMSGLGIILIVVMAAFVPAIMARQIIIDPIRRLTAGLMDHEALPWRDPQRTFRKDGDEVDQLYQELNLRTAAIRHERDISTRTFENLTDGVAITDAEFRIRRMNPALVTLLGGEPKLGDDMRRLLTPETLRTPDEYTEVIRDKRGPILSVGYHLLPESDNDDRKMVVLRDITRQRMMEKERVQNQKLVAMGTLCSGIAHDFNNLLAVILWDVEYLEKIKDKDPRRDVLIQEVIGAIQSGKSLTNQLLVFARKRSLSIEEIDLSGFIPRTVAMARHMIKRSQRVEYSINTHRRLFSDRAMLETALLNLLQNACDASVGGGTIRIEVLETRYKDDDSIVISVTDNGPPIPEEVLIRMTEPFFTTKDVGRGTGLGLSMVHGFCEQQGGRLEIESLPSGEGTVVSMILPAAEPD
ncbi:MAG: two-component system sensor histidine kinase NtrB [Paracoccus sp. (in: a-proteobacteria)]